MVAIINSVDKVLLKNNFIPVFSVSSDNTTTSTTNQRKCSCKREIKQILKLTRRRRTDRADAVGTPLVDGVLLQVRLNLRQWPRPGPRHHCPAIATAFPAASMLLLWLHLYAQLLLHCTMTRTSSGGCCRNGGHQADAHYRTPKLCASPHLHTLACFCCTCTFLQTDKNKWIMVWTCTVQKFCYFSFSFS